MNSSINSIKKKTKLAGTLILLITSFIWGIAFVPQSIAAKYIGPFTFNTARFFLAGIVLIPVRAVLKYMGGKNKKTSVDLNKINKTSIKGGVLGGLFLFIAGSLQQYGMQFTSAGKAGFITALYIVIIPVTGLFTGKKSGINIWIAAAVSLLGMYLLCIKESLNLQKGDFYMLLCSLGFTMQILSVERFSAESDALLFSITQFMAAGILSLPGMLIFERVSFEGLANAWQAIAFLGILSRGVAYTCQIIGQRYVKASVASMIMSLEAVFALLGGVIILSEKLTVKEGLGCTLMFAAIIIAQQNDKKIT